MKRLSKAEKIRRYQAKLKKEALTARLNWDTGVYWLATDFDKKGKLEIQGQHVHKGLTGCTIKLQWMSGDQMQVFRVSIKVGQAKRWRCIGTTGTGLDLSPIPLAGRAAAMRFLNTIEEDLAGHVGALINWGEPE